MTEEEGHFSSIDYEQLQRDMEVIGDRLAVVVFFAATSYEEVGRGAVIIGKNFKNDLLMYYLPPRDFIEEPKIQEMIEAYDPTHEYIVGIEDDTGVERVYRFYRRKRKPSDVAQFN